MIEINKRYYERSIKIAEIMILIFFSTSAILIGLSQDKLMKANEISLVNIELLETSLLAHQNTIQASINHLVSCNALDLTKYVREPLTLELMESIEELKEDCISKSFERISNSSQISEQLINLSLQYKNLTSNKFQAYQKEAENFSNLAFWSFILGIFLCFVLVSDMIIFKPKQ